MKENRCSALSLSPQLELYHSGPNLDSGPMPTLFYFALSGPDSLCQDPYNQPVQFLAGSQIRIFSLTLPAHENGLSPFDALKVWAEEMKEGKDPLGEFLDDAERAVQFTLDQKLAEPDKIAVAGLSRGGLLASLLAARVPRIQTILGYAPLVRLSLAKEFHSIANLPLVLTYDVSNYASELSAKRLRYYIGNRDTRVSTRACFTTVETIVEAAHEARVRPSQTELILSPSIGQMGHGTSPEIFKQGALWVKEIFKVP